MLYSYLVFLPEHADGVRINASGWEINESGDVSFYYINPETSTKKVIAYFNSDNIYGFVELDD